MSICSTRVIPTWLCCFVFSGHFQYLIVLLDGDVVFNSQCVELSEPRRGMFLFVHLTDQQDMEPYNIENTSVTEELFLQHNYFHY